MAAERGGAAALDGREHLQVTARQPRPVAIDETFACCANDVGHLEGWPGHAFL
jgi:hypothetical protein